MTCFCTAQYLWYFTIGPNQSKGTGTLTEPNVFDRDYIRSIPVIDREYVKGIFSQESFLNELQFYTSKHI